MTDALAALHTLAAGGYNTSAPSVACKCGWRTKRGVGDAKRARGALLALAAAGVVTEDARHNFHAV